MVININEIFLYHFNKYNIFLGTFTFYTFKVEAEKESLRNEHFVALHAAGLDVSYEVQSYHSGRNKVGFKLVSHF